MLEILIADDHPVVRQGIMRIIEDMPDMKVGGEAENGSEVLGKIREKDYDLVLLDISMPGSEGLEVIREIKKLKPHLPVLILTIHPEKYYGLRMLQAGASGYLTKQNAPFELIEAIRKVSQGGMYISDSLAKLLVTSQKAGSAKPGHETLSDREYQVMYMIAKGKKVKAIADELCISVKTIHVHRRHILEKMNMSSNAEIIRYAIQNGILES
ncbi:MAG: response regulator with a DNA-binding domain [Chloroflexi bacterium]|jgi:two-component system, NarL family, invasion response regulator UvrY|nr:response regulator with a DNA-binding domain [Chloroflexota bacterium]